jgi:hypothetical protein
VPLLADAIEELAGAAVDRPARPANILLRPALALEAGLNSLYASRFRKRHPAGHKDPVRTPPPGAAARSLSQSVD